MRRPTRADDERLLALLDLHDEGLTPEHIGRSLGMSARLVRKRIREVREDDCKADPTAADHWYQPRRRKT